MKIIADHSEYRKWIPVEAGLYVQPAWMDIFNKDWNARIAFGSDGGIQWMWPYRTTSRYGITKYGRPVFCPDNGPVVMKPQIPFRFDPGIRRWWAVCEIDDRSLQLDPEIMTTKGWIGQERFYQYFDLPSYPRDFGGVSKSKRKRMVKKSALEFCFLDHISDASELLLTFFHQAGHPSIDYPELKRIKDHIDQHFDSCLFGIRHPKGDLLAVQWLIGHRDVLYGWVVARDRDHPEVNARELLLWHIIQWARDRYKVYDLGGSIIPGVRQFNLEMGAQEMRYWRYRRLFPRMPDQIGAWIFGH